MNSSHLLVDSGSLPLFGKASLLKKMKRWSNYFASTVIIIAALVLTGWQFDIAILKRPVQGLGAMNPTTAILFIFSGISFFLLTPPIKSTGKTWTGRALAIVVLLTGLLRFISNMYESSFTVDTILFNRQLQEELAVHTSNRMAPNTAFNFMLVGLTLLLLHAGNRKRKMASQVIALAISFIALLAMVAYLYRVNTFYISLTYLPMSIHTATSFLLFAFAVFFVNPDSGIMGEFTTPFAGSFMARFLIPAAILVPVVLGFVRLQAAWSGIISHESGVTLLILAIILIFLGLTWFIVVSLNKRGLLKQETDRALRKSEQRVQTIFNAAPDAMIIVDEKGRITLVNQQTETLFGYTRDELAGQPVELLVPVDLRDKLRDDRNAYFADPKTRSMGTGLELFALRKNGTQFPVEISLSPLQTDQGLLVSASVRDISTRKALEDELKKSNAEMEAFTYSVSHDLRAPLRGIVGFTAILEEDYSSKLDNEAKRITGVIKANTLKMGHLIDDLLAFSRTSKQEINRMQINTDALVNEIVKETTQQHKTPAGIDWTIHPLPAINGDINLIRQVWINLVSNAVKYSGNKERPAVEIGAYPANGQMVFYIRDNGVGFDEQYKHKLFKVFQRLHSPQAFEGTGVGLALVEKIISRHGGKVWAKAEVNKGACFYFSLPVQTKN